MTDRKLGKAEYDRQYYQQHKEDLNRRRTENYAKKRLKDAVKELSIDTQLRKVLKVLQEYNGETGAPTDDQWFRQTYLYAKMLMAIKYSMLPPSEKDKIDLEQLVHIHPEIVKQ